MVVGENVKLGQSRSFQTTIIHFFKNINLKNNHLVSRTFNHQSPPIQAFPEANVCMLFQSTGSRCFSFLGKILFALSNPGKCTYSHRRSPSISLSFVSKGANIDCLKIAKFSLSLDAANIRLFLLCQLLLKHSQNLVQLRAELIIENC